MPSLEGEGRGEFGNFPPSVPMECSPHVLLHALAPHLPHRPLRRVIVRLLFPPRGAVCWEITCQSRSVDTVSTTLVLRIKVPIRCHD